MTDLDIVDSTAMPDGAEYRVRLQRDPDPQQPYDDGAWPILRMEHIRGTGMYVESFNSQGEEYVNAFAKLKEGGHPTETFERYLRIFHGVNHFHTYGPNQMTDYTYMAFDPMTWRQDNIAEDTDLSKEKPLAEIEAWVEGDVYGWVSEWRDNTSGIADEDDWQEEESCWGFYGREWAEQAAREELAGLVSRHKDMRRQGRMTAELIRRKLGGHLMASMEVHHDEDGNPTLKGVIGPVEVNVYTAPDGAIVVMIDSPTQSDSEHPTLRVHLNDETIYNASEESTGTLETEGDN